MQEKRYDVEAVKEMLTDYVYAEREIDNQVERLELLTAKIGLGAQVLTDMPKAHGSSYDRIASYVAQKELLDKAIKEAIEAQSTERKRIEKLLKRLRNPDERGVIRMRYLDNCNWATVRDMMFGAKDDFDGKEDSYLRRVYKLHGTALLNMARFIQEEKS